MEFIDKEYKCQNTGCRYHDSNLPKGCYLYADKCDEYNEMKRGLK